MTEVKLSGDLGILKAYMEEANWFDDDVYVVWLHGCTDGWPRAIFNSEEAARQWVSTIRLNPEGYSVEAVDLFNLAWEITKGKST